MENLETGNSQVDNGGSEDDSMGIESIMNGMDPKPDAKPDAKPDGEGKNTDGRSDPEYPAWCEQLPEDIRSNRDAMKQLSKFAKIGELAKSYSELEKKIGNQVAMPAENASEQEIHDFFVKIGKPDNADGYSVKGDEAKDFREAAFKSNLTDKQASQMFALLKERGKAELEKYQSNQKQMAMDVEKALQDEYGSKYEEKLSLLKKGVETFGGKSLGAKLKNSGLLFDVDVVKMFISLGEMAAENSTPVNGNMPGSSYISTREGGHFNFKDL